MVACQSKKGRGKPQSGAGEGLLLVLDFFIYDMTKTERGSFGTKIGVILATAGSAVGLGNIWRFPYLTGKEIGRAHV